LNDTVFDFLFLNGTTISAVSDIMDYFLAGEDQQQTNQPNN